MKREGEEWTPGLRAALIALGLFAWGAILAAVLYAVLGKGSP